VNAWDSSIPGLIRRGPPSPLPTFWSTSKSYRSPKKVYSLVMRTPRADSQDRETVFFSPPATDSSSGAFEANTGSSGKAGWFSAR
jgi:hypothetical protein